MLNICKLLNIHKTRTAMLSYLYDVVKPLKSIFFFFYFHVTERNRFNKPVHKCLSMLYLVSNGNFHKNTAGIEMHSRIPAVIMFFIKLC